MTKIASPQMLVGCFGFNGPLRQYFSLYHRVVSQREGEMTKMLLGHQHYSIRKAKTVCNFGLSECNGVKPEFVHSHCFDDADF